MDGSDPLARSIEASADPVLVSVAAYVPVAAEYERAHAEKWAELAHRFARLLPAPARILDAGCGPGRDLARFAARGHRPHGVDLCPAFLEMARAHAPVTKADLRSLERIFRPASFDGIWANASLVHLSEPEARSVLEGFARLLRPGGKLYACVHARGETGWWEEPDGRRFYTVWTPGIFVAAVEAAGLVVDDADGGVMAEVWATRPGSLPRPSSPQRSGDGRIGGEP